MHRHEVHLGTSGGYHRALHWPSTCGRNSTATGTTCLNETCRAHLLLFLHFTMLADDKPDPCDTVTLLNSGTECVMTHAFVIFRSTMAQAGESDAKVIQRMNDNEGAFAALTPDAAASQLPRLQVTCFCCIAVMYCRWRPAELLVGCKGASHAAACPASRIQYANVIPQCPYEGQ